VERNGLKQLDSIGELTRVLSNSAQRFQCSAGLEDTKLNLFVHPTHQAKLPQKKKEKKIVRL
jgi:hypothetical protein